MTTTIDQPKTVAEYRDSLMLDLGRRETEIHERIGHLTSDMNRLQNQARKHSEWQDNGAAQQAIQQAGAHQVEIRSAQMTLREMELEREGIVRGSDHRMISAGHTESQNNRHAIQVAYTEALAKFTELTKASTELVDVAKKLIDLSISMAFEPPAAALAIVKHV